jgi:hypothetical protein
MEQQHTQGPGEVVRIREIDNPMRNIALSTPWGSREVDDRLLHYHQWRQEKSSRPGSRGSQPDFVLVRLAVV